jgi:hypothetical protein
MSAGSITDIYQQIDDLDNVKSVRELLAKLKPILAELAYYSVTGDGAVMEMRENWHSTFTNYIREGVGSNSENASANGGAVGVGGNGIGDNVVSPAARRGDIYQRPVFYQQGGQQPRREQLPTSLDAIMKGTHMSFK